MNRLIEFYQHYFYVLVPAILVIGYFYITDPLIKNNRQMQSSILEKKNLVSWMHKSTTQLTDYSGQAGQQTVDGEPVEFIDKVQQLAKSYRVQAQMKDIKQVDKTSIQMRFESVPFSRFISMLEALLQTGGTKIVSLQIKRGQKSEQVMIDLTLST